MPPFVFPQQRYACIQCGKSCGQWRIWVEPSLLDSLRQHPLALRLEVAGQSYLEVEEGGLHRLGFDQQGRCFFLQDQHLCGLHASTGWQSKPRACRQFPFFLVETPEGVQVGLSFRCAAVQRDHGVEWSEHQHDLSQLLASGNYPKVGFDPAPVGRRSLTWSTYMQWEQDWRECLQSGQSLAAAVYARLQPLLDLLLDLNSFLALLEQSSASAVAWLEGDASIAEALNEECAYVSPRRGPVSAVAEPFRVTPGETFARYLGHVLERKSLWLGRSFLGRLLLVLVGERLLHYYANSFQDLGAALDLVEGEWLAHSEDLGPLEETLAATLLQFG
ncbi:YkgJ family cysteine cluster protein [bacterium]|nr:YkgJ family cysteine cluster protein [bacterium]